jgi:hypothetical protein
LHKRTPGYISRFRRNRRRLIADIWLHWRYLRRVWNKASETNSREL